MGRVTKTTKATSTPPRRRQAPAVAGPSRPRNSAPQQQPQSPSRSSSPQDPSHTSPQPAQQSGSRAGTQWTAEDFRILLHEREVNGTDYERIGAMLGGRTALACRLQNLHIRERREAAGESRGPPAPRPRRRQAATQRRPRRQPARPRRRNALNRAAPSAAPVAAPVESAMETETASIPEPNAELAIIQPLSYPQQTAQHVQQPSQHIPEHVSSPSFGSHTLAVLTEGVGRLTTATATPSRRTSDERFATPSSATPGLDLLYQAAVHGSSSPSDRGDAYTYHALSNDLFLRRYSTLSDASVRPDVVDQYPQPLIFRPTQHGQRVEDAAIRLPRIMAAEESNEPRFLAERRPEAPRIMTERRPSETVVTTQQAPVGAARAGSSWSLYPTVPHPRRQL